MGLRLPKPDAFQSRSITVLLVVLLGLGLVFFGAYLVGWRLTHHSDGSPIFDSAPRQ